VVVHGRENQELAEQRAAELRSRFSANALAVTADTSSPTAVEPLYREIHRQFRRLDILVNNAGIMEGAPLGMIPAPSAERMLAVNTLGPLLHLQQAARLMQRAKSGAIVNITSILGTQGASGWAAYSTSKSALVGLTRSSAKELAPYGIRVNAIAPGFIETEMTASLPEASRNNTLAAIGLKRFGAPEDVARAAGFLVSDAASYITGQILGIDGGMLI
jgi:3-oxoacyl-[acyl-carrier protein] reductase